MMWASEAGTPTCRVVTFYLFARHAGKRVLGNASGVTLRWTPREAGTEVIGCFAG